MRLGGVWKSARIADPAVLDRLCAQYGFNREHVLRKINSIEYQEGEQEIFGKTRPVIFVRTRGNGNVHEIIKGSDGILYCNCPAWVFRGGRDQMKPCKHLIAVIVSGAGNPEDWFQYLV